MNSQLAPDGIGTSESQLDWTIWSVTEDVALDGTCSKRKRAFLKTALPRLLTILEKNVRHAHPRPAPWHITTGVCHRDEIVDYVLNLNWSGWWFRHICRAADILKIPCPDQRFADQGMGSVGANNRCQVGAPERITDRQSRSDHSRLGATALLHGESFSWHRRELM